MTDAEALRRAYDLLQHFGLDDWQVKVIPILMRAGIEQSGVCRPEEKTIFLVDYALREDANALWLIRHEVAHAVTSHETEQHGTKWQALVQALRCWNGEDGAYERNP